MCDFLIRNKELKTKFYWPFWGADFYTPFTLFKNEIYDEVSINYFNKNDSFVSTGNVALDFVKKLKRKFSSVDSYKRQLVKRREAIKRVDYFLHYNKTDYELLRKLYDTSAVHLPFFYYEYDYSKLNETGEGKKNSIEEKLNFGNNTVIQLGHSASLSNNHFSLFENLSVLKDENVKFICPLSYGDKIYAATVIEKGKEIFGEKFIPLTEYLNKDDYAALLNRIDCSFMNHIRTEAAGNTFMMLAMGKKVFLNSRSNLSGFLINENVKFFDLNSEDSKNYISLNQGFSEEEKSNNRLIISKYFSGQNALNNLKKIFLT